MSTQDITADMFTRIRNACAVKKRHCIVRFSKFNLDIASLLKKEGYIMDFQKSADNKTINVRLKYFYKNSSIDHIEKISKPSKRIYKSCKDIRRMQVLNGNGILIVSNNMGVMSDTKAKALNLGGEVIGKVY
jgi:small subunit ribosomal protein S8